MYKMVLVDDEQATREGIATYFPWVNLGMEVVAQFEDGQDALDYIRTHDVDILFTDLRMEGMDGLELSCIVHQEYPDIQIVALSAYHEFEMVRQAFVYGVSDYVCKPTQYQKLLETFEKIREKLDERVVSKPDDSRVDLVQKVMTYIRQEYTTANLNEIAGRLYVNPNYLSQLIRTQTGETFTSALIRTRMSVAAELLRDRRNRIYSVAEAVGYNNAENFCRAFKKFYGKSPQEYRTL